MSARHLWAAAAAFFLAAVCHGQPVELTNPGFELDENADGLPDGWRTFSS